MAAKKKQTKKEVEVIEAEVVNEVVTAPESIVDIKNYSELKKSYDEISETVNTIRGLLNDTVNNYLKIGCLLSSISDEKLKELGCDSIYEFSKQNFNLGVTSTKNFINVYQRFGEYKCDYDDMGPRYIPNFVYLKEEFKDFSMSQLVELLPVADEDFNKFNPEMSCKEIRALKKQSQLTDYENEFYDKVRNSFLEIWNDVYSKITFETKNKIEDKTIIFDKNGSYSFNLPCCGKNIVIKLNTNVKNNRFVIYIETPRIDYNQKYQSFNFNYDGIWDNIDNIIKFINDDCYNFINSESNEKTFDNSYKIVCDAMDKISEKYVNTFISLSALKLNNDFIDVYNICKEHDYGSICRDIDFIYNLTTIPYFKDNIFLKDFKLTSINRYSIGLERILFENCPTGNNPDYELKIRINNQDIDFRLDYNGDYEIFDLSEIFGFYCFVDFSKENILSSFNSIFDMYLYFAKKFALERYEFLKKEKLEEANKPEDEDYDEDYDEAESDGDYDEEE